MLNNSGRFSKPGPNFSFASEYDLGSDELMDLVIRNPSSFSLKVIPIGVQAGTLFVPEPGYGFVMYGFDSATGLKYSEALINVAINSDGSDPSKVFPAKTGRGFRGSFTSLTLTWPQDPFSSTNMANFIIFKSKKTPWMGGIEAT